MIHNSKISLFSFLLFSAGLYFFLPGVSFAAAPALLTAEPAEVAAGSGFGETRIKWKTESGEEARLYFVREDNSLTYLGRGSSGEYNETWLRPGNINQYRLYPADNLETPLATLMVAGTTNVSYVPYFQNFNRRFFKAWSIVILLIALLIFGARYMARQKSSPKLANYLTLAAALLAILLTIHFIRRESPAPFVEQPAPDTQETMDAARQMFEGKGYVTYYHDNIAQPPRYPPTLSVALMPFLFSGNYPENVMRGAKFFALFYVIAAVFAAWRMGGRMAAMLTAVFIGVSPFAISYARLVLSETFTAAFVVIILLLLYQPTTKRILLAGAIAGFLVTTRLQMIVCLPALILALPELRQRIWTLVSASPFLLALGIFNYQTFGSFFKTGYDYWLSGVKPFALEYLTRIYLQGDGPWVIGDWLRGWGMIWICPCKSGGPLSALPNIAFYPLVLIGVFWIFAPPFVTLYGIIRAWKQRHNSAARFTLWLAASNILLFSFYFYQAARFMAAVSTLFVIFAALGLGEKLNRFIQPNADFGSETDLPKFQAIAEKSF